MIPKRIQRKRTRGWKLPGNSVCVNRPSKFGNPFKLLGDMIYVDAGHRRKIFSPWVCFYDGGGYVIENVVGLFRDLLNNPDSHVVEPEIRQRFIWMRENIYKLKGKNIACFCKEGAPCHADPLIEFANQSL